MAKVKVSELEGAALDWAVLRAAGWTKHTKNEVTNIWKHNGQLKVIGPVSPSQSWGYAGRFIDEFTAIIFAEEDGLFGCSLAGIGGVRGEGEGGSKLVAFSRAYINARLGDEIEIPDELVSK